MKDIVEHDGYVADATNSRHVGRSGLHGQIMNIQIERAGAASVSYEFMVGHRDARHAAAELALKYDAIVQETSALISQLIHDLDHIGSNGWCRGDVHGDELSRLVALSDKLKAL